MPLMTGRGGYCVLPTSKSTLDRLVFDRSTGPMQAPRNPDVFNTKGGQDTIGVLPPFFSICVELEGDPDQGNPDDELNQERCGEQES